ncbi:hypothetical protein [Maritalea porphyrae]|uniref:hypothetical protein n=1 Tax=Maritalea porphyrae TaxID=880732 RepID=UPI0022AEFF68|nr:hypothetical protein [Maritalea porphyrae]MCZ4273290.1 hypothetical protein [Maritalea porphyrae]
MKHVIYQSNIKNSDGSTWGKGFLCLEVIDAWDQEKIAARLSALGANLTVPATATALEAEVTKPTVSYFAGVAPLEEQETIGTEGQNKTIQTRIELDGEEWKSISEWVDLAPTPEPVLRKKVSRTEYYGLFTPTEEAMIRLAASEEVTPALIGAADEAEKARLMGVASLAVMLRRTDALGPDDTIDLASAQVIGGLDLLAAAGLLAADRKDQILAGIAE